jgi:tetratricopeptide (TPR) repeat protein
LICACGQTLQSGIAVLNPVFFPDEREEYEDIALGATRFARCPQCGKPNEHLEVCAALMFRPGKAIFIQMPAAVDERIAKKTLDSMLDWLGDDWTIEVTDDSGRFRTMALSAVLGLIDHPPLNDLRPSGARDLSYHSALVTVTRPGLLRLRPGGSGLSDSDALEMLVEARQAQIATSFTEAFANADVAVLEPVGKVAELFPAACFDTDCLALLHAVIEERASEGSDVTALRAAEAAAARNAGGLRLPGLDLARGLARLMVSGVALQQTPELWASLLDAEEVYQAIGNEAPPHDEDELRRAFAIAEALGHGDAVAKLFIERIRLPEDGLDTYIDAIFAVVEDWGVDDETVGLTLSRFTRVGELRVAFRRAEEVIRRLIDDRPVAAVIVLLEMSARLKNEGESERALALLDQADAWFTSDALPKRAVSHLLNERGNALRELHRYEEALRAYRSAIDIHAGDVNDADVRAALVNEARTLRDIGRLQASLDALTTVLPHTSGRERFECLFAMIITYDRLGDWAAAQPLIDEGMELVRSAPVDDQILRFFMAASINARLLGVPEQISLEELYEAVQASDQVSARQKLLTLGAAVIHSLRVAQSDDRRKLQRNAVEIARGLKLPELVRTDPQLAATWATVARLAGDEPLALAIVEAVLATDTSPVIAMHAACLGAQIACERDDWGESARLVGRAAQEAAFIAGAGSEGTESLSITETLEEVRRLGIVAAGAPAEPRYETLVSQLADIQCSLLLSLRLGAFVAREGDRSPSGATLQVLQWLDAGDVQVPLLTSVTAGVGSSRRGLPLTTALAQGLGARVAGRVTRSPVFAEDDVVAAVAPYAVFRKALVHSVASLGVDRALPLTVVPSAPLVGIPLHHALEDFDVAYAPSLAVAVMLSGKSAGAADGAMSIAEVRCSCFQDGDAIVAALVAGGEALRVLCERYHAASYRCVDGTDATRAAVAGLLTESDAIKLSCHGVTNSSAGRFALVLSDGSQLPPPLAEIATRDDLADRYLFDWSDVASGKSRCRLVVSSACTSGSGLATNGGEQVGLARAYLASGVLSFVAPLWPVAAEPAQELANAFIEKWLSSPDLPLATVLHRTRDALPHLPPRVRDAFVLHGHAGPLFPNAKGGVAI